MNSPTDWILRYIKTYIFSIHRLQPIEEYVVPEVPPKLDSPSSSGGSQTPPEMADAPQDAPSSTPDAPHLTSDAPQLTPDAPHLTPDAPHLTNGEDPPPLASLNSPEEVALLKRLEDANR